MKDLADLETTYYKFKNFIVNSYPNSLEEADMDLYHDAEQYMNKAGYLDTNRILGDILK